MAHALYTLTSRRFPAGVTCEIIYQIPGTDCYVVDVHAGNLNAYATDSELAGYGPDDSCDGWDTSGR